MSTVTAPAASPGLCNQIEHHLYSIPEKLCGLCSTDSKVYAFLVLGRVLQAAALVSLAASVAFAFVVGPVALVGLVATVALGALGTYVAGNPQELNEILLMGRPFVAGQPVGLVNSGPNCFLNSGLQLLANVPAFERRMRQVPVLAQFLDSYAGARNGFNKVAYDVDTQRIRQALSQDTRLISPGGVQEDASELFRYLFEGANSLYHFECRLNGAPSTPLDEQMIQLNIDRNNPIPNFDQLLASYFDRQIPDTGRRQELFLPRAPDDMMINVLRFYYDPITRTQGKIHDDILTPERFTLPNRFVRSGENSNYVCDAFIQHYGATQDKGHYVAYIKRGNAWWYCSDSKVYEVSAAQAQTAMRQSYILHYAKV